jgi:serine phosphatase RsbU (regulator of sigma subunit)/anti-sigma regulatory factor (Ser/Thr protein kinase)/anti-anti-sigma regulatory factor
MVDDHVREFGSIAAAADAFEHFPLIGIVTDGPDLRLEAFNAAARALTANRFVHGAPVSEVFPAEVSGQEWLELYAAPLLDGQVLTRDAHRVQYHQPDGTVLEVYLDVVLMPRPGPDGTPRGTIVMARDVTAEVLERRALERELGQLRERYSAARGAARAMQRALLPDAVPLLPSADLAARYVLAPDEELAGGDWFDAVPRPDGTVVLAVGDVVGHGQSASVAMGQLRSVLLAQLRAGAGIVEALSHLDSFADSVPAARRATVVIVSLDQSTGEIVYCTAGHPPPLLLSPDDQDVRYLPPTGAGPLATGTGFITRTEQLQVDETLVLYSDGILERPGVSPSAAAIVLQTTASQAHRNLIMPSGASPSGPERICELSIELLTRGTGHSDDITILAVERRTAFPPLDVRVEISKRAVYECRDQLMAWLKRLGAGHDDLHRLVAATTELVSNVVDHAYDQPVPPALQLTALVNWCSEVIVEVVDQGTWKIPVADGQRGRGLALVRLLVDHFELDDRPDGTTARIRHTVSRPAGLLDHPLSGPPEPLQLFDVYATGGPDPVVTVIGPFDALTAAEAKPYLSLALTEAAEAVTIDLTGVTLLASAGVDLLFSVAEQAREIKRALTVIAPTGSPAQHILTLVNFEPFNTR